MYAPNLPHAWEIAELERLRRIRESQLEERPSLPLPLPPLPRTPPARDTHEPSTERRVIVIDLA
jgi:hypothetical protein